MENYVNRDLCIVNGSVYTPYNELANGAVGISAGKITYIGPSGNLEIPSGVQVIDAEGGIICPGFIDLHVNGGGGKDITAATEEAIYGIAKGHAACGTTGLLVAVTGPTLDIAVQGLQNTSAISGREPTEGSKILGAQMEGPFVNPKRQGPVFKLYEGVTEPSVEIMRRLVDAASGALKIVNMAVEFPDSLDVVEYLVEQGIRVSIGHTDATFDEAVAAIEAGASYGSHIYNAMTGLHHREPGVVGALLTSSEETVIELVADGFHVHPAAIEVLLSCKGIERVVLATDATELVGSTRNFFVLPIGDGLRVEAKDGRTWGPKGELIGSVLQMNHAVRNMHEWFKDIPLAQIIASATHIPAKAIGAGGDVGMLEVGRDADVAVMDKEFEIIATIINGRVVSTGEMIPD